MLTWGQLYCQGLFPIEMNRVLLVSISVSFSCLLFISIPIPRVTHVLFASLFPVGFLLGAGGKSISWNKAWAWSIENISFKHTKKGRKSCHCCPNFLSVFILQSCCWFFFQLLPPKKTNPACLDQIMLIIFVILWSVMQRRSKLVCRKKNMNFVLFSEK